MILLAVLLASGTLVACGDDEEKTVTETVTTEETEPTVDTEDGESTDATTTTATVPGDVPVTSGPRYFQTPSGNIGCYVSAQTARCDIRERNWDPPASDKPCELDYGQGIALSASGKADFVCAGDTALGGPATLDYGSVSRRGSLRCRSGGKGVTCTAATSGHGFFLSREIYRIF
jgi:hypothetical protein